MNKNFDGATTILANLISFFLLEIVVDVASGTAYILSPVAVQGNFNKLQEAGVINDNYLNPKKILSLYSC